MIHPDAYQWLGNCSLPSLQHDLRAALSTRGPLLSVRYLHFHQVAILQVELVA